MEFDGSEVLIGKGAQAEVFRYQGYAYKVYKNTYPAEWIAFEKDQQRAVNERGICPIRYYDTDDAHIIKMDLIEGEQLEDKVLNGYVEGFGILADAFRKIHAAPIDGIKMPPMIATAGMGLSEEDRNTIFPIINRLSEKYPPCICHLDIHFLNIMIPKGAMDAALEKKTYPEFVIIDWMNARIAPAIFDYARTYMIFDEASQEGLAVYKKCVEDDIKALGITDEDFQDALKVSTIIRKTEKN